MTDNGTKIATTVITTVGGVIGTGITAFCLLTFWRGPWWLSNKKITKEVSKEVNENVINYMHSDEFAQKVAEEINTKYLKKEDD